MRGNIVTDFKDSEGHSSVHRSSMKLGGGHEKTMKDTREGCEPPGTCEDPRKLGLGF